MKTNDNSNPQASVVPQNQNPVPSVPLPPIQTNSNGQLVNVKKDRSFIQSKFFIALIIIAVVILIGSGGLILYKMFTDKNTALPFIKQKEIAQTPTIIPSPTDVLVPINSESITPTPGTPLPTTEVVIPSITRLPIISSTPTPVISKSISAAPTAVYSPPSPTDSVTTLPNSGVPSVTIIVFSLGLLLSVSAMILAGM